MDRGSTPEPFEPDSVTLAVSRRPAQVIGRTEPGVCVRRTANPTLEIGTRRLADDYLRDSRFSRVWISQRRQSPKMGNPSSLVDLETSFAQTLKPSRTEVVLNTCLNERSLVIDY